MKIRFPLYAQMLLFLILHLVIIGMVFFIFFNTQFGPGWEALIRSPAGDRVEEIAWLLENQMEHQTTTEKENTLERFGKIYGVTFYIFDGTGKQLGGPTITLPAKVLAQIPPPPTFRVVHHFDVPSIGRDTPDGNRFTDRGSKSATGQPPKTLTVYTGGPPSVPFGMSGEPGNAFSGNPNPSGQSLGSPDSGPGFGPPPDGFGGGRPPGAPDGPPPDGFGGERPPGAPDGPLPNGFAGGGHLPPHLSENRTATSDTTATNVTAQPRGSNNGSQVNLSKTDSPQTAAPDRRSPTSYSGEFPGPDQHNFGHIPGLPRFIVQTSNPTMVWIGTILPPAHHNMHRGFHNIYFLIASTTSIWQSRLLVNFDLLFVIVGFVLAISILIWLPFAYRITRSVSELTRATEKIADGEFETRLNAGNWDEIDSLKNAINSMSDRINSYIMGQRRFLGDIAHELCSPVARLQVATEILKETSKSHNAETVKDIQEDIEEMSLLINELLAFSKASIQGVDIELGPVNVFSVLNTVLGKVDVNHNVNISVDPGLYVLAEPVLFERAVSNILRNSVRYAGQSGPIEVTSECTKSEVLLAVLDNGPGMPPEAIKMLGQPFFRLEPSRNRKSGGAGLGLAIVKTCIESCGGTFRASNRTPQGLKVELRLVRTSAPGAGLNAQKVPLELHSENEPSVESATN